MFDIDDLVPEAPPLSRDVGRINIPQHSDPTAHCTFRNASRRPPSARHGLPHSHHQILSPTIMTLTPQNPPTDHDNMPYAVSTTLYSPNRAEEFRKAYRRVANGTGDTHEGA